MFATGKHQGAETGHELYGDWMGQKGGQKQ
jgi:hypothetical protein